MDQCLRFAGRVGEASRGAEQGAGSRDRTEQLALIFSVIGRRSVTYDMENRIKTTKSGSTTITYVYDGWGHRMNASSGTKANQAIKYRWDENANLPLLAFEKDGGARDSR